MDAVKAVVVYESLRGNTARIAGAIAEGIGPGARALSTSAATAAAIAGADLIVAGRFGPLRDGEVERAREWGAELAKSLA